MLKDKKIHFFGNSKKHQDNLNCKLCSVQNAHRISLVYCGEGYVSSSRQLRESTFVPVLLNTESCKNTWSGRQPAAKYLIFPPLVYTDHTVLEQWGKYSWSCWSDSGRGRAGAPYSSSLPCLIPAWIHSSYGRFFFWHLASDPGPRVFACYWQVW